MVRVTAFRRRAAETVLAAPDTLGFCSRAGGPFAWSAGLFESAWFGRTEFSRYHERASLSRTTTRGSLSFKRRFASFVMMRRLRRLEPRASLPRGSRERSSLVTAGNRRFHACSKNVKRLYHITKRRSRFERRCSVTVVLTSSGFYEGPVVRKTPPASFGQCWKSRISGLQQERCAFLSHLLAGLWPAHGSFLPVRCSEALAFAHASWFEGASLPRYSRERRGLSTVPDPSSVSLPLC